MEINQGNKQGNDEDDTDNGGDGGIVIMTMVEKMLMTMTVMMAQRWQA